MLSIVLGTTKEELDTFVDVVARFVVTYSTLITIHSDKTPPNL